MNNPYHKTGEFGDGRVEWNEYPEFQAWEEGRQANIKEVVAWLKHKMILRTSGLAEVELKQIPEAALLEDGVERVWEILIEPKEWQSKLKEWGC